MVCYQTAGVEKSSGRGCGKTSPEVYVGYMDEVPKMTTNTVVQECSYGVGSLNLVIIRDLSIIYELQ